MPTPFTFLRPLLAFGAAALLATAALAGTTTGSGQVASETRAASGFDTISMRGSIDVVVRQGTHEGLEIRADNNLLPLIETRVEGGTLHIGLRRGESVRTRHNMVVTVDVAALKSIAGAGSGDVTVEALKTPALSVSLSGSGDARLRQLATDELTLRLAGSGDVEASGNATRLKLSIAGSGDVNAQSLASDDVNVSIAGSGDASVTANKTLKVSIAGSGDVQYSGNATVNMNVVGSGSVLRK